MRITIRRIIRATGLLLALMILTSCVGPGVSDGGRRTDERSWMGTTVIEQGGKCRVICRRYGSFEKCEAYKC